MRPAVRSAITVTSGSTWVAVARACSAASSAWASAVRFGSTSGGRITSASTSTAPRRAVLAVSPVCWVTVVLVGAVGLCVLVLAGALGDAVWLRVVLVAAMGMALATLAVRIAAGVLDATR